jgi:hypothetical protein
MIPGKARGIKINNSFATIALNNPHFLAKVILYPRAVYEKGPADNMIRRPFIF